MRNRAIPLLALLLASVVLVAGCNSQKKTSEASQDSGSGGSDGNGETGQVVTDPQEFCDQIEEMETTGALSGESVEEATDDLEAMVRLAASAPPEIKSDVEVFVDVFEVMLDLESQSAPGEESDETPEEAAAALDEMTEVMELMTSEEVAEANKNVEDYLVEHCGREPITPEEQAALDEQMKAAQESLEQLEGQ